VGPPFGEQRVLEVAAAYQAETRHHVAVPGIDPGETERRTSVSAAGDDFEMRSERTAAPTS
jgi:hypothetical protein